MGLDLPCGHDRESQFPGCVICRKYREDARYAALWDGLPIPRRAENATVLPDRPPNVPACRFRGEALSGAERNRLGLGVLRDWFSCSHPEQPLGPFVCSCKGCGPRCPGYARDSDEG